MTRHKPDCRRVFKRYDPSCPRCQELGQGAKPRPGWGPDGGAESRRDEETLGQEHMRLVHPDGSECPDGCDAPILGKEQ